MTHRSFHALALKLTLLLMLTLTTPLAIGQLQSTQLAIGGNDYDFADLMFTTDTSLFFGGGTRSFGANGMDIILFELDPEGDMLWSIILGGYGDENANGLHAMPDGGFVLTGRTSSVGYGGTDMFFCRLDPELNVTSFQTYGEISDDRSMGSIPTLDGNFLVFGDTRNAGLGSTDIFLVKVDPYGNEIWSRIYGGSAGDLCYSVKETDEGDLIVCAMSESSNLSNGAADGVLMKLDPEGDILWARNYGGFGGERITSKETCQIYENGDIVVAGHTESYGAGSGDQFVARFTPAGELIWFRSYGSTGYDFATNLTIVDNGDLLVSGIFSSSSGDWDGSLMRVSGDGELLWASSYGQSGTEAFRRSIPYGSGVLVSGYSTSFGNAEDVYVLFLDSLGQMDCNGGDLFIQAATHEPSQESVEPIEAWLPERILIDAVEPRVDVICQTVGTNRDPGPRSFKLGQNVPNPFNPSTSVQIELPEAGAVELKIYDVRGRLRRTLKTEFHQSGVGEIHWDGRDEFGQNCESGQYYYQVVSGDELQSRKMLLLK